MTAATLEEANKAMRKAVKERLDNTPADDPKLSTAASRGPSAAEVLERFSPERPSASVAWLDAVNRLTQLHREKTAQYGGDRDPFENVTASAKCGVEPWRRALCDLSDCVVRMQKYAQGQPVDWQNALMDAANWALICLIKLEEEHRGAPDGR
jgi:hypothetical protein